MKFRISIVTPVIPGNPCNHGVTSVITNAVNVEILQNGAYIANGTLSALMFTGGVIDQNGNILNITGIVVNNIITIDIPFSNVWDYADIQIKLTPNGTGVSYFPYNQTFRIFGYDLGNDTSVSHNPNFNIVLVENNLPFSNIISYREPFTDKVRYYFASSSSYTDLKLYDDITGVLLSTNTTGVINSSDDIALDYLVTNGANSCYKNNPDILKKQSWLPDFNIINNTSGNCVNPSSNNNVEVHIDYTKLDLVYVDDNAQYPFIDFSVKSIIVDSANTLIQDEVQMGYTDAIPLPDIFIFSNYIIPTLGTYAIQVHFNIFGYEPGLIDSGNLDNNHDYLIQIEGGSNSNIPLLSSMPNSGLQGVVFTYDTGLTPIFDGAKLYEVLVTGNIPANKYYKIKDYNIGADLSNLFPQAYSIKFDNVFYAHSLVTPVSWGSLTGTLLSCPNYSGLALIETAPIITTCKTLVVDTCNTINVTQTNCNKIEVTNNGLLNGNIDVYVLTSGNWVQINTMPIISNETLSIDLSTDGVYRIDTTYNNITTSHLYIVDCNIQSCYAKYIDKLICCNTQTNCDSCLDDNCSPKEYYNFNAFSSLINTYLTLVSLTVDISHIYTPQDIIKSALLNTLTDIDTILNRAMAYCNECSTPC